MGLRQKLNENPAIGTVGALLLVLGAGVGLWLGMKPPTDEVGKAFYTVDDGKTLFEDRGDLLPPFQKDGKEAVGAAVYTCDAGTTRFVGYLLKYSDDYRSKIDKLRAEGKSTDSIQPVFGMLVKRPGDANWIAYTAGGGQLTSTKCPSGDGSPDRVIPE